MLFSSFRLHSESSAYCRRTGRNWPARSRATTCRLWLEPLEDRTLPSLGFGWAFHVGGTNADAGNGITTDSAGNLYVTGSFSPSTVNFDPNDTNPNNPNNTLTDPGGDDEFIAKYTSNKTFQWVTLLGRGTLAPANSAVDGAGNVYVGYVDESNSNTHVAQLDAGSGAVRWNVSFSGNSASDPGGLQAGVAVGPSGNAYVTGTNASVQAFVAKLTSSGTVLWNRTLGGSNTDGLAVAVDSTEHVYVAYASVTTTTTHSKKWPPPLPVYNIQIASLNAANGSTIWSGSMGNYGNLSAGVAVDGAGNVYVAGGGTQSSSGSFFVAKLADPSSNGALTQSWKEQFSGNGWASGVAVDSAGNVYTTGSFAGSFNFNPGPGTFILQALYDDGNVFVSELDTNGTFVAAADIVSCISLSGANNFGRAIALDGSGNIYTTGGFRGTANFNPTGAYDLTTNGALDVFVSQLTQLSSQPAVARGTTRLAHAVNLDQVPAFLYVPGTITDAAPFIGDGGSHEQTKILAVTQEALGTATPVMAWSGDHASTGTTSAHPTWQHPMSLGAVDWLFADFVSRALANTLVANASLAPLA
jgi:hypothetical protein